MRSYRLIIISFILTILFLLPTFADDYTQWGLPEGAKLRLGKGGIRNYRGRTQYQFTPDGSQLIVISSIGIWRYDVHTGKELSLTTKYLDEMDEFIVLSPDSTTFIDVGNGLNRNKIELWDLHSSELRTTFENPSGDVNSVVYHPNSRMFVTGDSEGVIRIWDIENGENQEFLRLQQRISKVAFSPDAMAIMCWSDGIIQLFETKTGKAISKLEDIEHIDRFFFGPNWKLIVGEKNREIRIWDGESGKVKIKLDYPNWDKHYALSLDGKTIADTKNNDSTVRLLDIHTGEIINTFTGENLRSRVQSIAFSPDGQTIAIASYGEVRLWDMDSGIQKVTLYGKGFFSNLQFSLDGHTFAARGYTSKRETGLYLWDIDSTDLQKSKLKHFITGHNNKISCLSFSPDGQKLASGHDYLVRLWDVSDGKHITTGHGHPVQVNVRSVGFSPDGKKLASLSLTFQSSNSNSEVLLWDAATGEYQVTLKGHGKAIGKSRPWHSNSMVFTSDGRKIVSGSLDGTVRYWNPRTKARDSFFHNLWGSFFGHHKTTLKGHKNHVLSVALSPDESMLASGSSDHTVRLWDVRKRKLIATLGEIEVDADTVNTEIFPEPLNRKNVIMTKDNVGAIHSLAFTPDGKTLIAGNKKQIVLWNILSTKRTLSVTLKSNNTATEYITTVHNYKDDSTTKPNNIQIGNPNNVKFRQTSISTFDLSPDGRTLAVGSPMGGIVLLDIPTFNVKKTYIDRTREWISDLSFNPDGSLLASGSMDGTVLIWELEK